MTEQEWKRTVIKSVRLNPKELNLIGAECRTSNVGFSEFVRAAVMAAASKSTAARPYDD